MQGACGKLDVDRLRKRPFRRAFAVGPFSNGTSFRQIEHRRRLGIVRAPVVLQDAEHLMIRQDEQPALPFGRRAEQLATSRLHQPAPPHFAVRAWRGRGMAILCRRVGLFGLAQGSSRLALGARRPHLAFVGDVHAEAEGPPESVGMAARHVDHRRLETAILIQDIRQGGSQRLLVRGYLHRRPRDGLISLRPARQNVSRLITSSLRHGQVVIGRQPTEPRHLFLAVEWDHEARLFAACTQRRQHRVHSRLRIEEIPAR
mmetsp:Transcript_5938/g.23029  ORF Transcript_5938/g.23029 Transcript_5938/m.23029 type:complete len:259 (+) Transcript_5938:1544-2320(+)